MAYYVLNGGFFRNREVLLIIKNTLCQRSLIITRRALLDCPSWYYVEVFSSTSEPSRRRPQSSAVHMLMFSLVILSWSQRLSDWLLQLSVECLPLQPLLPIHTRPVTCLHRCLLASTSQEVSCEELARNFVEKEDAKWKFSWRVSILRPYFVIR